MSVPASWKGNVAARCEHCATPLAVEAEDGSVVFRIESRVVGIAKGGGALTNCPKCKRRTTLPLRFEAPKPRTAGEQAEALLRALAKHRRS